MLYQLQIDGRPAAPARRQWVHAARDAVETGCAVWCGGLTIKLDPQAQIARLEPRPSATQREEPGP